MATYNEVPTLLDRPAAARLIGVKESTLRRWWSQNRGPAGVKLSASRTGRVLYPASELLAWSRDPLRYERAARPDHLPTYDPPRRQRGRDHE